MKIRIGDADVPRDKAMRPNLNSFLRHDQGPIEQCEIADRALPLLADSERAAGVAGHMVTDDDCARFFASEESKNLRGLALKTFAKYDIRRDRFPPPIVFDVPICFNVAHEFVSSVVLSVPKYL